jgi:thiaminase/transcriptional activator TenA
VGTVGTAEGLWRASADLARGCLEHPFVQGLRDGSLPAARYRDYLAQDAFFLDAFARAYACGVARAPDRPTMRAFHTLQQRALDEQRLHERVAAEAGIDLARVAPLAATRAYADFLLATAFGGSGLGELLAAMTPCMRLYRFLGTSIQAAPHAPIYGGWIETYAGADFGALVATIEALLDTHARGSRREADHYRYAMLCEHAFFEQAWAGGPA